MVNAWKYISFYNSPKPRAKLFATATRATSRRFQSMIEMKEALLAAITKVSVRLLGVHRGVWRCEGDACVWVSAEKWLRRSSMTHCIHIVTLNVAQDISYLSAERLAYEFNLRLIIWIHTVFLILKITFSLATWSKTFRNIYLAHSMEFTVQLPLDAT